MMTLMGMLAERERIDLTGMTSEITKVMASNPRRIAEIHIAFTRPGLTASPEQKKKLEHAARACPVAMSLSPEIQQLVEFKFD
jgi:uncharacterized OsmC-like protein